MINIKNNIYYVGVRDEKLRVFDIIMETKFGTTYNSYLIDDEKVCVVDGVKDKAENEFLENIEEVIGDRQVDYVVINHTELDHSGSIIRLIEKYEDITLVGTVAAINNMKEIANRDFKSITVKSCDTLDLGKTKLSFITAPNLHWPDTMFTYDTTNNVLFTCDFLGCHYAPKSDKEILASAGEEYARRWLRRVTGTGRPGDVPARTEVSLRHRRVAAQNMV